MGSSCVVNLAVTKRGVMTCDRLGRFASGFYMLEIAWMV